MPFNPTYASISTEGCDLHYWYQGSGPLLVFIAGGGGIGCQFDPIFKYLDHKYTVCTFDRRQSNASTVSQNKPLNPAQQCRDIIAICKALGREKTSIFGNSGGAVLALQFAVSYPEYLEHVIAHEAPTTTLLDDATHQLNRAFEILDAYRAGGVEAAQKAFSVELKGFENSPPLSQVSLEDMKNFFENEFLTFTIYCPDLRKVKKNNVSIFVIAGEKSADAFYARSTYAQAKIMDCPHFVFPGHHNGYESEPSEFASRLLEVLGKMDVK